MNPKRPKGYCAPTKAEKKKLPKGTLYWNRSRKEWLRSSCEGEEGLPGTLYAVPITPKSKHTSTPTSPHLKPADLDPKGEIGKTKCPLHLIPPQAMEETAHVHALGAHKYGPFNWRTNKVCATTYISAMMRHLNAWRGGEDNDPESGRSHLAHIAANCFILMDAMLFGKLVDDRAK